MATPFANPEKQFRTRRDTSPASIHNIYTFYEYESSESEFEDVGKIDIETLTLELSTENAIEHIGKVLKVASMSNTNDSALLRVFPITVVGVAKRWFDRTSSEHVKNWDEIKQNFIRRFYPPAMILEQLGEILEDDKVPIILGRPMLATAHTRIDVFGKKISLEVGTEQITFDINERESPALISLVCVINNLSEVNKFDEHRDLEELLLSDDDLGIFPNDNDLSPNLENYDRMFLSPPGSARINDDSSEMFCNPNSNSSISMDDFVEMDDITPPFLTYSSGS
ncbi:hypothetical protein Tco_0801304 [Tanacetum coccineum]|uniref:Retrotransposon gag domain-containing protein n=1 Tax=Tanacetum coccineum TaxID=301880 RepID=A0ABQ4ZYC2_9ASTR